MTTAVPDLSTISSWLKSLNVEFYQSDVYPALNLAYLQKLVGVSDAKIELFDDVLTICIRTDIKLDSISALVGELSQINMNLAFAKVFLDLTDNSPKACFSYAIHVSEEFTFNQFSFSLSSFEEEALQTISELEQCGFLVQSPPMTSEIIPIAPKNYH